MKAKIINKKSGEIVQIYNNVIKTTKDSIEYFNNGYRTVIYIYPDFEYIEKE